MVYEVRWDLHSFQVGSLVTLEVKRQTSASSPWHPTNRRILKLFSLDIFGLPPVTSQWWDGFAQLL